MENIEYPFTQRRLRTDEHIRELTASIKLSHTSFIQPLFAEELLTAPRFVTGLNGVQVDTVATLSDTIAADIKQGITKFLLFPVPAAKHDTEFDFSFAVSLVKKIKQEFGHRVWLACDLCLCSYTTHGHCGIINSSHSKIINHKTVEILAHYAALLAAAGADCIAPSDMMDGRIAAIRTKLDALGLDDVTIMSYAAKFTSQFYGPFRDACHSAPQSVSLSNRRTYQVSPFNPNDALSCALRDEREGADILMVKPASLYSDMIAAIKKVTSKPLAAYHVSGEYAAIELLAAQQLVHRELAHIEVWAALQRAGADIIISYAARNAKRWLGEENYL